MTSAARSQTDIFAKLIETFTHGIARLFRAEVASSRLSCALLEYRISNDSKCTSGAVANNLEGINDESYDAFRYITSLSYLIYATTLLDTFLTDTTLFLFLRFPESIGSGQQVALSDVLAASSRSQVITETAVRKARELSFSSFVTRVEYLRRSFGLGLQIPPSVLDALDHYPSVRNTAVHDQGIFNLGLADDGTMTSRQKACFRRPTPVSSTDIYGAISAYQATVASIAEAITVQVLKAQGDPSLCSLIKCSVDMADFLQHAKDPEFDVGSYVFGQELQQVLIPPPP